MTTSKPFRLERRTQAQIASKTSDMFLPWPDALAAYGSHPISTTWSYTYSKTKAVQDLLWALRSEAPDPSQEEMLRALLTDRGLLFPQTRERWYGDYPERSMRLSLTRGVASRYNASLKSSEAEPILDRLLRFGTEAYNTRQFNFEGEYPFISREKALDGIRTLVAGRSGPFCLLETDSRFLAGNCMGDLGRLNYCENAAEIEYIMSKYLDTLQFHYSDSEWIRFQDIKSLLPFNTVEFYEFFVHIFPQCLRKESIYHEQTREGSGYLPSLNTAQKDAFDEQVQAYSKENLTHWKHAYPVLKQYLFPDLSPFDQPILASEEVEDSLKECTLKLEGAFEEYYNRMEPASRRGQAQNRGMKQRKDFVHKAAIWFLSATSQNGTPIFWTQPHIIFCLARSPLHRYLYNYENRKWKPNLVIDDAYYQYPLPITCQSLQADEDLFRKITDVCADICRKDRIAFPQQAWRELWKCIQQSTECLSFHQDDMNSLRYRFSSLRNCSPKGLPILDLWLDEKLTGTDAPAYIALWRTLTNKFCNPSASPSNDLLAAFSAYQSYFENPATDESLESFFTPLCAKIKWNKIPLSPTDEEIQSACKALKQDITPKESKKIVDTIKHNVAGDIETRSLEIIYMEWLFLQRLCDQARWDLMEAVYLYLTKTAKDQA